ncbi:MAG: NAD(P)/FAD-dependent oxidoreductase [Candidatus Pacebacteria bacterium]|nr:NAD(P)/FAD-dependent oxidoreductase [Candidatus Paceibacterota bacterium]
MLKKTKILIIGNGFGGVYALKNLHKILAGDENIELSMIGEKNYFLFTPLLHEVATGGINGANIIEPIRKVLGGSLRDFYLGKAEQINLKDKNVVVGEAIVSYDYLVIAPGAETNFFNTLGADKYAFTLKSIDDAVKIKNHCITQMERASHVLNTEERKKMLKFVIIGGGPTGVELVAEMEELVRETFSHYYRKEVVKDVSIVLIQRGPELVPQFGTKIRTKSLSVLQKKGVNVLLNTAVKEVGVSYVVVDENKKIDTETVIWVGGIKPASLNFTEKINKSPDGRIIVNEYLQLDNYKEVFAIGDIALFKDKTSALPALAQVAEKQSKTVAKNIKNLMDETALEKFSYHSSGNLMSLGQWMAVGEIAGFSFSGHLAWWFWRTVYLSKLISFRKKVRVAVDWTMNIFSPRDISKI